MADLGKMSRNALACFRALYFPLALLEVGWVLLWFPGSSLDHVTHNRVVWRPSMWHSFGSRINLRSEKTSWFLQRQYPVPQQKCKYDLSLLLFHVCRNSVLQGSGGRATRNSFQTFSARWLADYCSSLNWDGWWFLCVYFYFSSFSNLCQKNMYYFCILVRVTF